MKIDKKRKIQGKTNYRKRLRLLESKSPRLVVRKTNKYLVLQIIESRDAQDFVKASVNTKELLAYGWPKEMGGSLKSVAASYLAGLLIGVRAKIKTRVILDTGLLRSTKGSRIYAAVKGVSDAGIEIPYNDDIIPDDTRIQGRHLKKDFSQLFNKIKEAILKNGSKK